MSNQPLTPELLLPHTQSEEAWEAKLLQWRAAESIRELVSCAESDVVDFAIMQSCHSYLEEIPGDFHFPAKRDLRKPPQWQPTEKREEPRKRTVNLKAKAKARAARKRRK